MSQHEPRRRPDYFTALTILVGLAAAAAGTGVLFAALARL